MCLTRILDVFNIAWNGCKLDLYGLGRVSRYVFGHVLLGRVLLGRVLVNLDGQRMYTTIYNYRPRLRCDDIQHNSADRVHQSLACCI